MRGLFLKDWYMAVRYCRAYFLVIGVFTLVSVFTRDVGVLTAYPCMFAALIPVTLYSYDEREKWLSYCAALPVRRAQYVSAKYLLGLGFTAAVLLVSAALHLAAGRGERIGVLLSASALGLAAPAVVLPMMFRFGTEKARILYFVVIGLVTAVTYTLTYSEGAPSMLEVYSIRPGLVCLAGLAVYAVSWRLSAAFFRRREL